MESSIKRTPGHPVSFHSFSAQFDTITLTSGPDDSASTVELKVHTITSIFNEHDTLDKLTKAYSEDRDFRHKYAACFHPPGADLPGILSNMLRKPEIPHAKEHGWIVATFVTRLEWLGDPPEGTEILNNRLTIAGLGRIYFGEVVVFDTLRSVTLLRFELGSDTGGDATARSGRFTKYPLPARQLISARASTPASSWLFSAPAVSRNRKFLRLTSSPTSPNPSIRVSMRLLARLPAKPGSNRPIPNGAGASVSNTR